MGVHHFVHRFLLLIHHKSFCVSVHSLLHSVRLQKTVYDLYMKAVADKSVLDALEASRRSSNAALADADMVTMTLSTLLSPESCPKCSCPFEYSGSCAAMMCPSCKAHFCLWCRKIITGKFSPLSLSCLMLTLCQEKANICINET